MSVLLLNIKPKIKQDHQDDGTYHVKCPEESCREDCMGETRRRLSECVIDYSGHDKTSHVLKHCIEKEHKLPSLENFMILTANYKKNKFREKISESLYMTEKRLTLKVYHYLTQNQNCRRTCLLQLDCMKIFKAFSSIGSY